MAVDVGRVERNAGVGGETMGKVRDPDGEFGAKE